MTQPITFDGFTVNLSAYPDGLWGFAARARAAAWHALHRLHAREIATMVALQKDCADVGVAMHPSQAPVEIALRSRDNDSYGIGGSKFFRDPFRFSAHLFPGANSVRPYVHLDVEDPLYYAVIRDLPGVEALQSGVNGHVKVPDLVDAIEAARGQGGIGLAIEFSARSSDLRHTWEATPGIEELVIREQPSVVERVERVRAMPVHPREDLNLDAFEPLTVQDLYQYTANRR